MTAKTSIRVGISTCLLGENVRYDRGHKLDHYLHDVLGAHVEFVPVCPEVECGLGVPRESMRLVGTAEAPRLLTTRTGVDHTERLLAWARQRVCELERERLCGFVFKSKSPSSGMERVKVYNDSGMSAATGIGLFAREFMAHFPLLPVEEEGRLNDPVLRENFIERLFVRGRWHELLDCERRLGGLVAFHTRHKLLVLSHSPAHYTRLGRLVADGARRALDEVLGEYERTLMDALRLKATPRKQANVLQHVMGYFKKDLSPDEKQELLEVIDSHRQGVVPLIVPMTLLNHYVRKYGNAYLAGQVYLHPHPAELQLRNHV